MTEALADIPGKIAYWRDHPVQFVRDCFRVEPDVWQAEALEAYAHPGRKRVSRQACAGPGKSAELAWEGLHFLTCFGDEQDCPKGACVSISRDNLRDNLWTEFAKWIRVSPLHHEAFKWTAERIFLKSHPEEWWISARAWPKGADPETQGATLSGLHSRYVWFGIDEAGDIPIEVKKAAEQALAQSDLVFGCISIAGNPISKSGMLYLAATMERSNWTVISITGDPDDPNRSQRVDIEHNRNMIRLYGRDDPWVKAYILGQFPDAAINQLLTLEQVEEAMGRNPRIEDNEWDAKIIGCDVAREGLDVTAIYKRQHNIVYPPIRMRSMDGPFIAGKIAAIWNEWGADACFVDNTGGWGGSVMDHLNGLGFSPVGVQYSGAAEDPRFFNKRTENWWRMAEAIKSSLALPDVPELRADLTVPTYSFKGDRILLEDKEQIRKRLKRSPDDGDALSQCWHQHVAPKPRLGTALEQRVFARQEYAENSNPWADLP